METDTKPQENKPESCKIALYSTYKIASILALDAADVRSLMLIIGLSQACKILLETMKTNNIDISDGLENAKEDILLLIKSPSDFINNERNKHKDLVEKLKEETGIKIEISSTK
jgi:hypothetical protein